MIFDHFITGNKLYKESRSDPHYKYHYMFTVATFKLYKVQKHDEITHSTHTTFNAFQLLK